MKKFIIQEGGVMPNALKVFSGSSNPSLAREICRWLKIPPGDITCKRFSDGEIYIKINENVRGVDTFIVQSTFPPAENILELLLMIDAAKRASARRITAVIPYFGYGRQDKKDEPRVPISAKLIANLLKEAGADRVLTMNLHAEQLQGFFDIPVDHLYAIPVISNYLTHNDLKNFIVVAPDTGRAKTAWGYAKRLGDLPLAIVDKRRPAPNQSYVTTIVGEVRGKNTLVVDDIIDTGGTIVGAARALKENGALKIYCCCVHPILSGKAKERIEDAPIEKLIVTDTIPVKWDSEKLVVLSVAELLGEAIGRIHDEKSVSSLFI
jgi:ribose-phosphate pyrophosphokinase